MKGSGVAIAQENFAIPEKSWDPRYPTPLASPGPADLRSERLMHRAGARGPRRPPSVAGERSEPALWTQCSLWLKRISQLESDLQRRQRRNCSQIRKGFACHHADRCCSFSPPRWPHCFPVARLPALSPRASTSTPPCTARRSSLATIPRPISTPAAPERRNPGSPTRRSCCPEEPVIPSVSEGSGRLGGARMQP